MFKKWTFLLCTFWLSISVANVRGDFNELYKRKSPDDLVFAYMEKYNIPGLQIAIVQAPYIPRVVAYGLTNKKTRQLVSVNTIFPLGQLSMGFANIAGLQLVEKYHLTLDTPIGKYLTDIPKAWQNVTIKQLISQTSGIQDYSKQSYFADTKSYTPKQLLMQVQQGLEFPSGTKVALSRTNYVLLGLLIEKVSGMSYKAFIKKFQFEPLGLKHTFFISELPKRFLASKTSKQFLKERQFISPPNLATGYNGDQEIKFDPMAYFVSGDMAANAQDISVWDVGLAGSILVKDKNLRNFLFHPIKLSDGTVVPANGNWQFPGRKGLMHISGKAPGFLSYLDRFTAPKDLLCVTILANQSNLPNVTALSRTIASAFQSELQTPEVAFWVNIRQSPYTVKQTANRLKDKVIQAGGKVFAEVDNQKQAKQVAVSTLDTVTLLIGNPSVGSKMIKNSPKLSLIAPIRIAIWQSNDNQVWVAYPKFDVLAELMGEGDPQVFTIDNQLSNLVERSVTAY